MKKIITCLASLLILTSVISAETIGKRFFEIQTDAETSEGNNAMGISELFQETVVFDFPKIYQQLPANGFSLFFYDRADVSINTSILGVKAGVKTGFEGRGNFDFSKDFFKLLGEGNKLNEELEYTGSGNADMFAYLSAPVSLKVKGISISAAPSVFVPMLHAEFVDTGITVQNPEEGGIKMKGQYAILLESSMETNLFSSLDFASANYSEIIKTAGFDMALGVKVPLFLGLQVTGNLNMPVIPGKFVSKAYGEGSFSGTVDLFASENKTSFETQSVNFEYSEYSSTINRPLTVMSGVEWDPLFGLVTVDGSVGFGVRYPFSARAYFYPQYYGSARVNLLNILGAEVSTEYMNQIFKHEAAMMFNVRLLEIDAGVSLSGTDFANSWRGKGFGGFLTVSMGF